MILKYTREQVVALSKDGMTGCQEVRNWDICMELKNKTPLIEITEKYRISSVHVWRIKKDRCSEC